MSKDMMIYFDDGREPMAYDDTYDILIHCDSEEARQKTIEHITSMQWIPCSKLSPNKEGKYLVTASPTYGCGYIEVILAYWRGRWLGYTEREVIAWMPLPEPYEEDDHETD